MFMLPLKKYTRLGSRLVLDKDREGQRPRLTLQALHHQIP
jgi:hypothetical protein